MMEAVIFDLGDTTDPHRTVRAATGARSMMEAVIFDLGDTLVRFARSGACRQHPGDSVG